MYTNGGRTVVFHQAESNLHGPHHPPRKARACVLSAALGRSALGAVEPMPGPETRGPLLLMCWPEMPGKLRLNFAVAHATDSHANKQATNDSPLKRLPNPKSAPGTSVPVRTTQLPNTQPRQVGAAALLWEHP